MSEKNSVTCPDCGKMYRDFAPEGDPTCQCAEKAVRAMKEAQLNERCKGEPPAIPRDEERRLRAMTAFSDETGREPFQSPQHIIEGIILRRLHDKRIEGYTLEMSKEIEAALSAAPVGDDVPALKERIRLLEWAIAAKDKQILQFSDALSAPVAQEPVAWQWRYKGPSLAVDDDGWSVWLPIEYSIESFRETFADKIERGTVEYRPLYAGTPPATPAGVGADEIARIIEPAAFAELCRVGNEDAYWDDQEKKASALKKANAILALLSRGSWSDQTKLQKDGSR